MKIYQLEKKLKQSGYQRIRNGKGSHRIIATFRLTRQYLYLERKATMLNLTKENLSDENRHNSRTNPSALHSLSDSLTSS